MNPRLQGVDQVLARAFDRAGGCCWIKPLTKQACPRLAPSRPPSGVKELQNVVGGKLSSTQ